MTPAARRQMATFAAILAGLHLPFLGQAFHIDDANFLMLADGALADPWRPHDALVNWLGTPERAFDVLSNPPGVAYVLALVKLTGGEEFASHVAILPFTALATWGFWRLARRFCAAPQLPALVFAASPAVVVSAHLVMPDMPLVALYLAGLALAIEGVDKGDRSRALAGAALLGGAAMFRYSGLTGGPLLALYLIGNRERSALGRGEQVAVGLAWAAIPTAWALHDLHAYGSWHFWHMIAFQGAEGGGMGAGRKLLAQLCFTGGVACLPLLPLAARPGAGVAGRIPWGWLAVGLPAAAALWGLRGGGAASAIELGFATAFVLTAIWLWAVAAARTSPRGLGQLAGGRGGAAADQAFLATWAAGILVFNLFLRFVAARYLLLGLAPLTLMAFGGPLPRFGPRLGAALVGGTAALSLTVSLSEALHAESYRTFASTWVRQAQITTPPPMSETLEVGAPAGPDLVIAGHWGFQHYLEAMGARAASEEEAALEPGTWVAVAALPWPQEAPYLDASAPARYEALRVWAIDHPLPLRTLSTRPAACFHANAVATQPMPDAAASKGEHGQLYEDLEPALGIVRATRYDFPGADTRGPLPFEGQAAWLPWTWSLDPQLEVIFAMRVGEAP